MNRRELVEKIQNYAHFFPEEKTTIPRFLTLLQDPRAYQRNHLPGHITGSAWIIDAQRRQTLLVHHAKLGKWVQPGGHADGDENILAVALREAREETGLGRLSVVAGFFDIDIHPIPARPEMPGHDHYDVRFLLEADPTEPVIVSEESFAVQWIEISELEKFTRERSVLRMREKLGLL